jgi:thiol-disulfide isomerase/thioredoxin
MSAGVRIASALVALALVSCPGPRVGGGPAHYPFDVALESLEGPRVHLPAFAGQVVVVTFFATWCLPCLVEIPYFNRLQEELGPEGLVVIGISVDEGGRPILEPFREEFDVRYRILLADEAVMAGESPFGPIPGIPATFLIDRRGEPVTAVMGAVDQARFEALIESVLEGRTRGSVRRGRHPASGAGWSDVR